MTIFGNTTAPSLTIASRQRKKDHWDATRMIRLN